MHGHAFNDPIIPRYIRTYACVSMSVYMLVCDMCACVSVLVRISMCGPAHACIQIHMYANVCSIHVHDFISHSHICYTDFSL